MKLVSDTEEFPLSDGKWEEDSLLGRLRSAVRNAGGGLEVSRRSGVPYGTLNRYLAGSEPKWSNMGKIAQACGVSLDWLATGRLSPPAGQQPSATPTPAPPPPPPASPPGPVKLFATVNIDLLAAAMEGAERALIEANPNTRNWRARAQLVTLLYDEASARLNELNN